MTDSKHPPKASHGKAASTGDDPLQAALSSAQQSAQKGEVTLLKEQLEQAHKEREECESELQKFKDLAGRAQADLQNAKSRIEREAGELRKFAGEQLIRRILPTLDNFQRAFQHVPAELAGQEWVRGVGAIEADLMRQMAEAGLTRMQSLGQEADSLRHEILMTGPGEEGKVTEVFEEGYELHGKALRPARVKVGMKDAEDARDAKGAKEK